MYGKSNLLVCKYTTNKLHGTYLVVKIYLA